jgi:DNA-binding protein H-NS
MKGVNLKAMTVDALIDLRDNIDRTLSTKVAAARQELNSKLEKLNSFLGSAPSRGGTRSARKGRKVAPKYRGPEGETWAGRGARPRWLTALLKRGRKIEEFAINKAAAAHKKPAAKRSRRKRRKG